MVENEPLSKIGKTLMLKIQPDLMDWLKLEAQRRRTTVAYFVRTLLYENMDNAAKMERKVVNG